VADKLSFIGRGEAVVQKILEQFYPTAAIIPQYPVKKLIPEIEWGLWNPEHLNHKFDFMVDKGHGYKYIIEVNYKHGAKADKKSHKIWQPFLNEQEIILVRIDDWECKSLFKKEHQKPTWDDYIDVINAMKLAGANPVA
jgi:hypothetical protein